MHVGGGRNDEEFHIEVRVDQDTVWLTQAQMAELFNTDRTSINRHIRNIFQTQELYENSTCAKIAQVRLEGGRSIKRVVPYCNLDMIISVGYRVNSISGTRFRQWANRVLKEHMLKGFSVNQRLVDRQKRIMLEDDEFFIDLVLYNRLLRCFVVIEIKTDKITHQDLGQLQMYVNYHDRIEKLPDENPTIGILLCAGKNDSVVKMTLPEDNKTILASERGRRTCEKIQANKEKITRLALDNCSLCICSSQKSSISKLAKTSLQVANLFEK